MYIGLIGIDWFDWYSSFVAEQILITGNHEGYVGYVGYTLW